MYVVRVIWQVGVLSAFYYVGGFLKEYLHIPLPGSIIGLLLLLLALSVKVIPTSWIQDGANALITVLPLLLVPVTVSIVNYPELLSGKGVLLLGIVIFSTVVTMVSVGWTSQLLEKKAKTRKEEEVECTNSLSQ